MRVPVRASLISAVLACLTVACAVGSPLALATAGRWWELDWRRLADIGQAYGAASAVFSALAVAAVAASLVYQGRQLRLARIQLSRDKHERMMMLAIGDPDTYGTMFGPALASMPPTQLRRRFFCLMALNYFKLAYENGTLSEHALRTEALPSYFSSMESQRHWVAGSQVWLDPGLPAVDRRFGAIVDDEYRKAVVSGPPVPEPRPQPSDSLVPCGRHSATTVAGAVLAAAIAGWLVGRRAWTTRA